jgi:hypothetical protein
MEVRSAYESATSSAPTMVIEERANAGDNHILTTFSLFGYHSYR